MKRNMAVCLTNILTAGILAAGMAPLSAEAAGSGAPDEDYRRFTTDDGHIYYLVLSDCTWSEALERAMDAGGYLVNIDGWTEYSTILHKIIDFGMSDIRFRIGACREEGSRQYHWVDEYGMLRDGVINDPNYWSYSRWITGGPSFYANGADEDVLEIMFYQKESRWVWNDVPDDIVGSSAWFSGKVGYIVEFDPESTGYDYASSVMGWGDMDTITYDEASQTGDYTPYDPADQKTGARTYDEANQSGGPTGDETYDVINQSGDPMDSDFEGPGEVHFPEEVNNDPSQLLSLVPDSFVYTSGAGVWATTLSLNDDGTFQGVYSDLNAGEEVDKYPGGTEYLCVFSGNFRNFRKIDEYTWAMDLDQLNYESKVGENWFDKRDQIHYIASEAEGLAGGDTFYLYLKGHPMNSLPKAFVNWISASYDTDGNTLGVFGIYNQAKETGFAEQ